jgi:uncharacterized protein YkwD
MLRHALIVSFLVLFGCSSAGVGSEGENNEAGQGGTGANGGTPATGGGTHATGGASTGGTGSSVGGSLATGGSSALGGGRGGTGGSAAPAGGKTSGGSAAANSGSPGAAGSASTSHTNPLSKDLIDAFVSAHNAARASTDLNPQPSPALPPVSWDPILADSAYNYLSKCVSMGGQLVDHNANRSADYQALGGSNDYVGENIYATTGNTVAPADAVNDWMSEASSYDYTKNDISKAGHYTQVVWRTSVRIGCAIVNCPNARFNNTVLCDYAPGGNVPGQKPY